MEKIIGLSVFAILFIVICLFLWKGKIGSKAFTTLFCVILICGLAFDSIDRLKELSLGNLRMILTEMETTKKEVIKEKEIVLKAKENVVEAEEKINIAVIKYLGDMSMWHNAYGGDRRSYTKLLNWQSATKNSIVSSLLSTEIERVKDQYRVNIMRENIDRWNLICKPHAIPSCGQGYENPKGFSAGNVLAHLSPEKRWDERVRAACLLRNIGAALGKESINKEELFEKLVKHMDPKIENSLCAAKMALETYKDLAKFSSKDVFDFSAAIKDWETRKAEILEISF